MMEYISGLFREDKPQSMGRLLSFLTTIIGLILIIQVPPEDRMTAGLSVIGIGLGGKSLSKVAETHIKK